jgi:hypothetical protein
MGRLEDQGFLAFTVALAPADRILPAIRNQLARWWSDGIREAAVPTGEAPLLMAKEHNPWRKTVRVFDVEGSSPSTLIEANLEDGYYSLSMMVSEAIPDADFVSIRSAARNEQSQAIQSFHVFRGGRVREGRLVRTMMESYGWDFFEMGQMLPFEEAAHYSRRLKKERVTRPLIARSCKAMGFDLEQILLGAGVRPLVQLSQPWEAGLP